MVQLSEYVNKFYFILENGSLVFYEGNVIGKSIMKDKVSRKAIRRAMNTECIPVVSDGVKAFLPRKSNLEFVHKHIESYYDYEIVNDLCKKAHDVLKISAFVETNSTHGVYLP